MSQMVIPCGGRQQLQIHSYNRELEKVQRFVERSMTVIIRSIPKAAMGIILHLFQHTLHLLPLIEFVVGEAVRSILKLNE